MGIQLGICGVGAFAQNFIPLFKHHPGVDRVVLCDLDREKLTANAAKHGIPDTCPSLDALCELDVDAIAIFTQHHLHGPQALQALRSGKHVYSAVPSAITIDEMRALVQAVEETGNIYMVGETSYHYPCAIYCRERFRKGDFGHIVYAEGEYYHDYSHGLYDVARWRHGENWRKYYGMPPFFYPTHSTSMIVSVTGAHVTHVCGMGIVDRNPDNLYTSPDNVWNNPFSNEVMLCRMSDGSVARINEFRYIGHPGAVSLSLYGTDACYEEQTGTGGSGYDNRTRIWVTRNPEERINLDDLLRCEGVPAVDSGEKMRAVTASDGTHLGVSKVHDVARLPKEFIGLPNGHAGSHQFLVDDFVRACLTGRQPPNNVWMAARYLIPGLVAHQSALQGGVLMEVPDLGDPPSS